MGLETYSKAKDWALALLLVFIAGVAWDIRVTVSDLHDDNIVTKKDLQSTQKEVEEIKASLKEERENNKSQEERIREIQAILNPDNRYWQEKKRNLSRD